MISPDELSPTMLFTRDMAGVMDPPLPLTVGVRDGQAFAIVRRELNEETERVGVFEHPLTPQLEEQFGAMAKLLATRELPEWKAYQDRSILRYDFSWDGKLYSGTYGFNLESDFNLIHYDGFEAIFELVHNSGTASVGLGSWFQARPVDGGTRVELHLSNPGVRDLVLAAPRTWAADQQPRSRFIVAGVTTQTGVDHTYYLREPLRLPADRPLTVPGRGELVLEFKIPADEQRSFEPSEVHVGAGRLRLDVLAPSMLKGWIASRVAFRP